MHHYHSINSQQMLTVQTTQQYREVG